MSQYNLLQKKIAHTEAKLKILGPFLNALGDDIERITLKLDEWKTLKGHQKKALPNSESAEDLIWIPIQKLMKTFFLISVSFQSI